MEDKIKVAGEIAAHTYPLSEKSLCRLAAILEPRKLLKNELFLKEGDVARSMGVVEQGMVRQFYRKKNLEITEHFTYEGHLFVCLESFIRQIPGQFYVAALGVTGASKKITVLALSYNHGFTAFIANFAACFGFNVRLPRG